MKCEIEDCGDPIVDGKVAYINGKIVCQRCFYYLRESRRLSEGEKKVEAIRRRLWEW